MGRNLPACGPIPLLYLRLTIDCDRAGCRSQNLFARVHRDRPAGRAGGCDRAADRDRGTRLGAIFQFRRLRRSAAAPAPPQRGGGGWFGGDFFAPFQQQQQPASAAPGFFPRAAAGQARHRSRAQRAGARRRHGRLARLWPGRRLHRAARYGRDPQAQDRVRPDQVSAEGRARRLGRRRQGHPRDREARRHRRHARPQRSRRRSARRPPRRRPTRKTTRRTRAKTDARQKTRQAGGRASQSRKADDAATDAAKPDDKPADAELSPDDADNDAPQTAAPEKTARSPSGLYEFRDERWVDSTARRSKR